MSIDDICDKLDIIIALLSDKQTTTQQHTEQTEQTLTNMKHALNRSKHVNDEQRTKILEYIRLPKVADTLKQLPKHKQQSALQTMIKDELNISISYYMSTKLVNMIHSQQAQQTSASNELDDIPIETTKVMDLTQSSDEFLSE